VIKRYWVQVAAVSANWFLFDFIIYPFTLYSSTIITSISSSSSLVVILGLTVVVNLLYLPGTIGGAFCIDYLGPKNTQIIGLLLQGVVGFIMSGAYRQLAKSPAAFTIVYGIFMTLGEFSTGNCTFLLAGKSGPTAVRAQCYGIAAAAGKLGAFVGIWAFPPMIKAFSRKRYRS